MKRILSLAIILLFLNACSQQTMSEKTDSGKSQEYVNKIGELEENPLPDEWYEVDDKIKLPERWNEIASRIYENTMKDAPEGKFFFSNEEIVGQLTSQYKGTFKSTRNSSITIVSSEKNLFVTITDVEISNVLEKSGEFDSEKLKILGEIFC